MAVCNSTVLAPDYRASLLASSMPSPTMGFSQVHATQLHAGCLFRGRLGLSLSRHGPLTKSNQEHAHQERWPHHCTGRLVLYCRQNANGSSAGKFPQTISECEWCVCASL